MEVALPHGVTATEVVAGGANGMAIGSDGNVYAWGDNTYGQLGQGYFGAPKSDPTGPTYSDTPLVVVNPQGAVMTQIATHTGTMMELTSAGTVYTWGYGVDGEIGNGAMSNESLPTETFVVNGADKAETVTSIAVGQQFAVAAAASGAVYTWGDDAEGALGLDDQVVDCGCLSSRDTPSALNLPSGVGSVTSVSAGAYDGYALTSDGDVISWGLAAYGSLGDGNGYPAFQAEEPVVAEPPAGGGSYVQISAGDTFLTALSSKGEIDTWGQNDNGQYGTGSLAPETGATPTAAVVKPAGVTITAVASGGQQSYALSDAAPPVFTTPDTATFVAGTKNSFTVRTTGAPAATLVPVPSAMPAGITYTDNGDGTATISGDPPISAAGSYQFTIAAAQFFTPGVNQYFTLTIDAAPHFSSLSHAYFGAGRHGSFTISTVGFPTPTIAKTGGSLPPGLTFTVGSGGTATISGTPTTDDGSTSLALEATNGVSPLATQSLKITIRPAPSFTSGASATFTAGRQNSFTIRTTGTPFAKISTASHLPDGVILHPGTNGTAVLSGVPFEGSGGVFRITLQAANPVITTMVLTLTVDATPSLTSSTTVSFTIDLKGSSELVVNPGYPASSVTLTCSRLPGGLTFSQESKGSPGSATALISGDPDGSSGTFTVKLTAKYRGGSVIIPVKIVISPKSSGT